jgi:hypothetical protein
MLNHVKIYKEFFDIGDQDYMMCEMCGRRASDVHHIDIKGMGGSKTKDYIENLAALCRRCHNEVHDNPEENRRLKENHIMRVKILKQMRDEQA